ncbi:hypothetical protein ACFZBE_40425, partial [Streptomyces sp. NPDC008061]|uniref:hypothetical protein n=1 Tax=Streptomyces sp. NPDC008061 TaxID=3364805 RepID=UPI0036F0DC52
MTVEDVDALAEKMRAMVEVYRQVVASPPEGLSAEQAFRAVASMGTGRVLARSGVRETLDVLIVERHERSASGQEVSLGRLEAITLAVRRRLGLLPGPEGSVELAGAVLDLLFPARGVTVGAGRERAEGPGRVEDLVPGAPWTSAPSMGEVVQALRGAGHGGVVAVWTRGRQVAGEEAAGEVTLYVRLGADSVTGQVRIALVDMRAPTPVEVRTEQEWTAPSRHALLWQDAGLETRMTVLDATGRPAGPIVYPANAGTSTASQNILTTKPATLDHGDPRHAPLHKALSTWNTTPTTAGNKGKGREAALDAPRLESPPESPIRNQEPASGTGTRPGPAVRNLQEGPSRPTHHTDHPAGAPLPAQQQRLQATLAHIRNNGIRPPVYIDSSWNETHTHQAHTLRGDFEELVARVDHALHGKSAPDRTTADTAIGEFLRAFSEASALRGGLGGGAQTSEGNLSAHVKEAALWNTIETLIAPADRSRSRDVIELMRHVADITRDFPEQPHLTQAKQIAYRHKRDIIAREYSRAWRGPTDPAKEAYDQLAALSGHHPTNGEFDPSYLISYLTEVSHSAFPGDDKPLFRLIALQYNWKAESVAQIAAESYYKRARYPHFEIKDIQSRVTGRQWDIDERRRENINLSASGTVPRNSGRLSDTRPAPWAHDQAVYVVQTKIAGELLAVPIKVNPKEEDIAYVNAEILAYIIKRDLLDREHHAAVVLAVPYAGADRQIARTVAAITGRTVYAPTGDVKLMPAPSVNERRGPFIYSLAYDERNPDHNTWIKTSPEDVNNQLQAHIGQASQSPATQQPPAAQHPNQYGALGWEVEIGDQPIVITDSSYLTNEVL